MKVFKFGGASVQDVPHIENVAKILSGYDEPLVVVISAMGKSTNAIEEVIKLGLNKQLEAAIEKWDALCDKHFKIVKELNAEKDAIVYLEEYQLEGRHVISEYPKTNSDEFYDQLISFGELMSTTIVVSYLISQGVNAKWMDARKMIKTDERFRSANIQWRLTESAVKESLESNAAKYQIMVTQGFIGRSRDGRTTTLGREGSDYTAAIISYCIDSDYMAVWKDVPGVLTGDPRLFPDATLLHRLSYREAIEMTYYGAQVIHPKTIQPIQRKEIPLFVKSFKNPIADGTEINKKGAELYPPMIVVTENQYLLEFSSKDFSFIAEHHLSMLFRKFNHYRIRVNLMRNTAISFTVCVSAEADRLSFLKEDLQYEFTVKQTENLELITVRHYNNSTVEFLKRGKDVLFEEIQDVTFQMVTKKLMGDK